jgi:signal transduction histidine kinase
VIGLLGWALASVLLLRALRERERIARACHEVRGPLTALALAVRTPQVSAAAVEEQVARARVALDDLAGWRGDRLEQVCVEALLDAVEVSWEPVCAAYSRALAVGPAPPGLSVLADRTRLLQALGNLIANALEHGEGTIEVRPRVAGTRLRLEVRDGGSGLGRPLAEIVRRPRAGVGRRGRGLAIAADVAQRYAGELTTKPGATLVLELPAVAA